MTNGDNDNIRNCNQNDDVMPSQMSQEQSNLAQAQNKNGVVWTKFSGFQDARETEHNSSNQDEEDHVNNSAMFDWQCCGLLQELRFGRADQAEQENHRVKDKHWQQIAQHNSFCGRLW